MKSSHAAALALVGWYLLAPPSLRGQDGKLRLDRNASLSTWEIIRFEGTQQRCERVRTVPMQLGPEAQERKDASICIASDDPRLEGK
jgi:hypothetical protein